MKGQSQDPIESKKSTEEVPVEEVQSEKSGQFVSRVSSLPIIQDGFFTVHALANRTSLGRLALSTANSTLSTVTKYTSNQPKYVQDYYENYIQPQIARADALGCRSLDLIENKFPVVNQPTSDIVKAVTTPSYEMVNGVKVKIDSSIKQPANTVAKEANKRFGNVVDNVEAVIDRYLPTAEKKSRSAADVNQAVRAYYVLNDATLRLTQCVSEQVKMSAAQIPRSRDDISRMTETSALIQKAANNIQVLQDSVRQSVLLYAQSAQQHLPPNVSQKLQELHATTNERLQGLTQQVSTQLQQVLGFLKTQSSETPEWLKNRISSLTDIANKQIELVRAQYSREDLAPIEKAKNVAHALQSQVLPVVEMVQSQLNYYTEIARQKAPTDLSLLGLTHVPKMTSAQ
ncbi:hypothetical protein BDB01DRAFT_780601 [Pilobolus umbonatus]|nr:hypothetical protein BDB01DRAFT_780601 [Pilobolus umbonatus]